MDDLAPAAGSRSLTPPASASSSHEGPHTISPPGTDGFRLPTMAPASISFEAESLMSSMVIPDDWLETVGPPWRLYSAAALARALQEIEKPVVDRSTAIAVTSALTLIMKDFSMENDERRIKSSAIQMAVVLAHSLAEVTSREPMRKHFTKYLREELERRDVRVFEDTLKECVTENLDFACTLITQSTISRTTREMEESIATELEKRQTVPWNNSDSPVLRHWLNLIPGPSKVDPISRGLTQEQLNIYKNFSAKHAESTGNHWILPFTSSNSEIPWREIATSLGSNSIEKLWSGKCHPVFLLLYSTFSLTKYRTIIPDLHLRAWPYTPIRICANGLWLRVRIAREDSRRPNCCGGTGYYPAHRGSTHRRHCVFFICSFRPARSSGPRLYLQPVR